MTAPSPERPRVVVGTGGCLCPPDDYYEPCPCECHDPEFGVDPDPIEEESYDEEESGDGNLDREADY